MGNVAGVTFTKDKENNVGMSCRSVSTKEGLLQNVIGIFCFQKIDFKGTIHVVDL